MLAETVLRKLVPFATTQRGDDYFSRGRVRSVKEVAPGIFEAEVDGAERYRVDLIAIDNTLNVGCECPWYTQNGAVCKHIWAAVRAAATKGVLPDELRRFAAMENDRLHDVPPPSSRKEVRPAWQRFLESLPTVEPAPRKAETHVPDEIGYLLISFASTANLSLHVLGRSRKRDGEWGKWKPLSMRLDDLHLLDPFDAEVLALLNTRTFSYVTEPMLGISRAASAWWVEKLARAGRLLMNGSDGDPRPVGWDDGPPWKLRIAIVSDAGRARYRIEASVEREEQSLPLGRIAALLPEILIADGNAARFDDDGRSSWLQALRASGPIEVPFADTERFRDALLRAPLSDVTLPPELGWDLVAPRPQPLLALQHDGWSAELVAELFFVYDEWRVADRSPQKQLTADRKLIRRDPAEEQALRARLTSLPIIAAWDGYRIRARHLEEIARRLLAEGWRVEIDASPVRVTDDIDVEISSGIDWFDLNVSASFGELRLALPELLAAAEAKRSLLRLSDGSYGIVPTSWNEALAPVLELGKREGDAVRFRPAQALLIDALLQEKPPADEAFEALRARLGSGSPEPRQEPPTLRAELRPYQRAGLGWLQFLREAGIGGCLADDMGLGKTVQALALLESLRVERTGESAARPSLVVAPRSLLFNWAAEARKFAPELRVKEHHGADRTRSVESFAGYDLILTTYATMRLDVAHLSETEFDYVILDEAQAIKNSSSQVAKASRLLRGRHRLALSGTPIENHLGELWSLFEFLNPGLLGSSRSFSRTFAAKTTPPERRNALARALRPLILRRTKEQVAPELPERTEQTLYCELEESQRKQYDELRDHYRAALLGQVKSAGIEKSRMQILEALLRLRQAACHPKLINPAAEDASAKTELLMEELRDVLASGHRALVFSQFTSFLGIVRNMLDAERVPYLYLDGKTADRQSLVEQFQGEDGPPLFLISLKAGGLGLNLTNADYIFLLDPWWNPAVEAQAIDRAHRIGRLRPVVAYRLIARDTVEEKILELQARKRELAESIISEDNSVLRRLEVEDLEMLLG